MVIMRGKKTQGAFDQGQYYLEAAARGRVARKLRHHLRRMTPVVLHTPRWSQAPRFLDDLAVDLAVGEPHVEARTLSMAPTQGRSVYEGRTWVLRGITEFCSIDLGGPVTQAVDRKGFRHILAELLTRTEHGPRKALLLHGVEHLNVEARADLIEIYADYLAHAGTARRLNLVLASSLDPDTLYLPGAEHLVLQDFGETEALESLVEWAGATSHDLLWSAVDLVGGVPALLDAVGAHAEQTGRFAATREELWRALGPLADEVRGAVSIVVSDDVLADRLEEVARRGPVEADPELDERLERAGLLHRLPRGSSSRVIMRAPVFSDLAMAS